MVGPSLKKEDQMKLIKRLEAAKRTTVELCGLYREAFNALAAVPRGSEDRRNARIRPSQTGILRSYRIVECSHALSLHPEETLQADPALACSPVPHATGQEAYDDQHGIVAACRTAFTDRDR